MPEVAFVKFAREDLSNYLEIDTQTFVRIFDGPHEYRIAVRTPSAAGSHAHFGAVIAEAFRLGRESR